MRRKFRRRGSGQGRNSWDGFDRGKIWEVVAIQEHRPFEAQGKQECLCHERRKAPAADPSATLRAGGGRYIGKREGRAPPLQSFAGPPFLCQGKPEGGWYGMGD